MPFYDMCMRFCPTIFWYEVFSRTIVWRAILRLWSFWLAVPWYSGILIHRFFPRDIVIGHHYVNTFDCIRIAWAIEHLTRTRITNTLTNTQTRTYTHSYLHTHTHTLAFTRTLIHAHKHSQTHSNVYAPTSAQTHAD